MAVIIAGRAHSRYLDRAEARAQLVILPLSTGEFPDGGSQAIKNAATAVVPVAVFVGERILICSAQADQANEIFKPRNRIGHIPSAAEAPDLSSAGNTIRKLKVPDDFRFKTSWKAS
ncbi:hypothetical protein [Bradyrhizobium genosp. A]|uniref:hypothetical protein n=1 Tax=Bradyrhizobium genosp. A TaxID=83626 RepID=UPI003CF13914